MSVVWSEELGRRAVTERAGGRCELCGTAGGLEWAHRVRRGQGGTWSPVNGCHLCRYCHAALTHDPPLAAQGGWEVPPHGDPARVPVWLSTLEGAGWWLLTVAEDGVGVRRHVREFVDPGEFGLPGRPVLPREVPAPRETRKGNR